MLGETEETKTQIIKIVQAFSDMGHSGSSAVFVMDTVDRLLHFKNLKPLTAHPSEWQYHDAETWGEPGGIWQNRRNSEAFSHDGGIHYYLLSDKNEMEIYTAPARS